MDNILNSVKNIQYDMQDYYTCGGRDKKCWKSTLINIYKHVSYV